MVCRITWSHHKKNKTIINGHTSNRAHPILPKGPGHMCCVLARSSPSLTHTGPYLSTSYNDNQYRSGSFKHGHSGFRKSRHVINNIKKNTPHKSFPEVEKKIPALQTDFSEKLIPVRTGAFSSNKGEPSWNRGGAAAAGRRARAAMAAELELLHRGGKYQQSARHKIIQRQQLSTTTQQQQKGLRNVS